jgi:hypothetical protein
MTCVGANFLSVVFFCMVDFKFPLFLGGGAGAPEVASTSNALNGLVLNKFVFISYLFLTIIRPLFIAFRVGTQYLHVHTVDERFNWIKCKAILFRSWQEVERVSLASICSVPVKSEVHLRSTVLLLGTVLRTSQQGLKPLTRPALLGYPETWSFPDDVQGWHRKIRGRESQRKNEMVGLV